MICDDDDDDDDKKVFILWINCHILNGFGEYTFKWIHKNEYVLYVYIKEGLRTQMCDQKGAKMWIFYPYSTYICRKNYGMQPIFKE